MSDLRQRAIGLLARREHTRMELLRKLAPHGMPEEIESVVTNLAATGLQSDARFAESYVRSHTARFGAARLRQALRIKGVDAELANAQLAELPDERVRLREVWQRKFSAPPINRQEWAKQARFLQGRGFAAETICNVLKEIE